MKSPNQKLKLLYILKILQEQTDEEHPVTVSELIDQLSEYGIRAERKSVYRDLEALRDFGVDICNRRARAQQYFIGTRDFELPELKVLVDSVQASRFISHKKSMELIAKLELLTSASYAKQLQRQVVVASRVKSPNENIYYNVDKIHEAIAADRTITFQYFDWDVNKEKVYRREGARYTESPLCLSWDDENYYMIVYKEKYGRYVHYRVDKMDRVEVSGDRRIPPPAHFDPGRYAGTVFSMYGGEETAVAVRFANHLANAAFDRFGMDRPVERDGADHFIIRARVAVSPHFLSWILSFGGEAEIVSPLSVRRQMTALLQKSMEQYQVESTEK